MAKLPGMIRSRAMTSQEIQIASGQTPTGPTSSGSPTGFFGRLMSVFQGTRTISPGIPLPPMPQVQADDMEPWGPLQFQYGAGRNLNATPRGDEAQLTSFAMLRNLSESFDIARICIDYVKDVISATPWDLVSRSVSAGESADEKPANPRVAEIKEFLRRPDQEHTFAQWMKIALEEVLVVDALTIYPRQTLGGRPYSLEIVDGTTIKPLLDVRGRRPPPPFPAFQQTINGVNYEQFTAAELIYAPMNPRAKSAYGFSPLERMLIAINTALRKQLFELKWFTEGNTPDALLGFSMGNSTPSQTRQFQQFIDDRLRGDDGMRRGITVVPIPTGDSGGSGGKMDLIKFQEPVWERHMELWLVQVTCAALAVTPAEIGFTQQTNRSSSQGQENVQERRLRSLYRHFSDLITDVVVRGIFGEQDLVFRWVIEPPVEDALKLAQVDDIHLKQGTRTQDELRERDGLEPKGLDEPMFVAQSTAFLMKDLAAMSDLAANPPAPPPPSFHPAPPVAGAQQASPSAAPRNVASQSARKEPVGKSAAAVELDKLNAFLAKGETTGRARRPFRPDRTVAEPDESDRDP